MARVTFYFDVGDPIEYQHVAAEIAAQWLDVFTDAKVEELVFRLDGESLTAVPRWRLVHLEIEPDDDDDEEGPRNQGDH
jgi:hypothetical protein